MKEKQEKNRENEDGWGEARVPTQPQLNLRGPGASAALVKNILVWRPFITKFLTKDPKVQRSKFYQA